MTNAAVRAIFLDIDGTIVGASNTVSPRVREAIRRAREGGCEVVLCTGRSRVTAQPIADQLGFRGHAVLSNGAVVMNLGTGELICRNLLPVPIAVQAIRVLLREGVTPLVYEDAVETARILYHPDLPFEIYNPERFHPWPRMAEDLPFRPACIGCYGAEAELRPVADRLAAAPPPETYVEQAGTHAVWCLEIHHQDSGKCNGLQRVTERLGVRPEEVLAIGDHINDLRMLRFAGIGVAMGNAVPEVLAGADWITAPLDEDGVAVAIERFILGA
ncbi:MAG TPA: HAD family hydrolase [Armatimonadota bacterium]|nr:HAD family hydrolase [Armatimonadota bacterium]